MNQSIQTINKRDYFYFLKNIYTKLWIKIAIGVCELYPNTKIDVNLKIKKKTVSVYFGKILCHTVKQFGEKQHTNSERKNEWWSRGTSQIIGTI